MKWSFKIARLAGIDIYIHATFFLLLLWVGYSDWSSEGTVDAVVEGVFFVTILFGCIVMHEMGHALAARHYGIQTRDITLWPIGGVASLESMPEKPLHEMVVAFAGPLVNVVIAGLIWLWLSTHNALPDMEAVFQGESPILFKLLVVNLILALFNLLPAFPMDGGRILRALLSFFFQRAQATRYAARIGQFFAVCFGLLGLAGYGPMLMLIAVFLWLAAGAESNMEQMRASVTQLQAHHAMMTDFAILEASDPLSRAVDITLAGHQRNYPVRKLDSFVGVLTQHDLLRSLAESGPDSLVGNSSLSPIDTANASDSLLELLQRMQQQGVMTVIVYDKGAVRGLITLENILELIQLHDAIQLRGKNPGKLSV